MKISTGQKKTAVKGIIYGPEGVGKSTLASHFPKPVFLDLENGTNQLDVQRIDENKWDWKSINETVEEIAKSGDFKTIVIDTADMAELHCNYSTLAKHKIDSIAQPDYGRGYMYLKDEFQKFLNKLTRLNRDYQINIVFLGHSKLTKFEQPDEFGAYDRYELKLEKKTAQAIKEWGDFVLFLNYKIDVVKADGKMGKSYKATGGKRVIYTTHSPTWDAKNRFGLDEELPLNYDSIKQIFQFEPAPTMHVTENDPLLVDDEDDLDEPMIVQDEDAEDLKDIVGDPTAAKIITRLTQDGLKESEAVEFIKSKKIKPVSGKGNRLADFDKNFLKKNVLDKWDNFKSGLLKSKGA